MNGMLDLRYLPLSPGAGRRRTPAASPGGPDGAPPAVGADLLGERPGQVLPARRHPVGVHVLAAVHGRDGAGQPGALVRGAVDLDALAPLLQVGPGAQPGHERAADVAQERQRRGERRVQLRGAQVEQAMAGAPREGAGDAGPGRGGQPVVRRLAVSGRQVGEHRAGGQDGQALRATLGAGAARRDILCRPAGGIRVTQHWRHRGRVKGLALNHVPTILAGAIPAVLMALAIHGLFEGVDRLACPAARGGREPHAAVVARLRATCAGEPAARRRVRTGCPPSIAHIHMH
jgi:hypothetical protein